MTFLAHHDTYGCQTVVQWNEPRPAGLVCQSLKPGGILSCGTLCVHFGISPVTPSRNILETVVDPAVPQIPRGHEPCAPSGINEIVERNS